MEENNKKYYVPIWKKSNLTIEEAVAYSGIGRDKLRDMTSKEDCPFVLWIGNKRMIKRRVFDAYIDKMYSIRCVSCGENPHIGLAAHLIL